MSVIKYKLGYNLDITTETFDRVSDHYGFKGKTRTSLANLHDTPEQAFDAYIADRVKRRDNYQSYANHEQGAIDKAQKAKHTFLTHGA